MNEIPELYRFVQGQIEEANIMIALDVSGFMNEFVDEEETITRLDIAKQALTDVMDTLAVFVTGVDYPVNIRITAWSSSHTSTTSNNATPASIETLKTWINNRSASGGTNFEAALTPGLTFFPTSRPAQNLLFFITDGLPSPAESVDNAVSGATGDLVDPGAGDYTRVKGTAVSIYGINIALEDTSQTARIDNTPQDGVPVIEDGDASALQAAIENVIGDFPVYTWTFTGVDRDITYAGEVYESVPIGRSNPESGTDMGRANLDIKISRDNPVAENFLRYIGDAVTSVTVFQRESESDVFVFWRGRVASTKVRGDEVILECESVFTSLRRSGLRARFQRNCRHTLYGSGCGLDKEAFKVEGTYDSLIDRTVVAPFAAGYPNGWFTGGMLRAPDGSSRYILSHTGSILTISRRLERLEEDGIVGESVISLFPGCAHNRSACANKFNNLLNYGGFPWIPNKNPF